MNTRNRQYPCCEHCVDDQLHIAPNTHDLPCDINGCQCWSEAAASAEIDRLTAERDQLARHNEQLAAAPREARAEVERLTGENRLLAENVRATGDQLGRCRDECNALRAEVERLRPLAVIGAQIEAHTIGKVGHVVLPDGTMWWKPVDRFVAHLLAAGAVSGGGDMSDRAVTCPDCRGSGIQILDDGGGSWACPRCDGERTVQARTVDRESAESS